MLVLNCTKAAADFFTLTRKGEKTSPLKDAPTESILDLGNKAAPISQWLVHAIKIQRKHVLIAVHSDTRYAMVFSDLKKGDWESFINLLAERLFNNLANFSIDIQTYDEATHEQMWGQFMVKHTQFHFCQRGDRSIQPHLNDVSRQFEDHAQEIGTLPNNKEEAAGFDAWVNYQLRRTKAHSDYFHPNEEMFIDFLAQYGELPEEQLNATRNKITELRKAEFRLRIAEQEEEFPSMQQIIDDTTAENVIDLLAARKHQNK